MTSWKGFHGALSKMYTSSKKLSSVLSFAGMHYDLIQCRKKWWYCLFQTWFFFTMYSLKYSSAASPDVVLVMGEELFAQPTILVVVMLF
jgi:hypothetical protein